MTSRSRRAGWAAIAALFLCIANGPAPARAACVPPAELTHVGIALASVDARGQWVGRWLGAHPLTCEGDIYVLAVVAPSWTDLEQALRAAEGERYIIGDIPYVGDDTCIPGAQRHWWGQGTTTGEAAMRWEVAGVPPGVPAFPCPVNVPSDGPLVLRLMAP